MLLRPLRAALLAAAGLALGAQVQVALAPRQAVILSGDKLAFTAQVFNAAHAEVGWAVATIAGAGARIGADGVLRGTPGLYRVTAVSLADLSAWDTASVQILPDHQALRTVRDVLGPEALAPRWSDALPFRDLAGPGRFGDPRAQVIELGGAGCAGQQTVGYGLKVPVLWPRWNLLPDAQMLSYLESGEPVRIDATGGLCCLIQARGAVTRAQVEALNQSSRYLWTSRVQQLRIRVRGLVPLAGNPVAEPGDADGSWLSARFRRPLGLAMLASGVLVAADPEAHVLRTISSDREVVTRWGAAGRPGHLDGLQGHARFRGPTFVAAVPWPAGPSFVVSDSGNHVIRAVDALGRVTTLAGGPGEPGHLDAADPLQARFDDPQGLAVDSDGTIFVADRGNHVIRAISPATGVTTLAGLPGAAGTADGTSQARFSGLRGLAIGRAVDGAPGRALYAADGHSVRRVGLDGSVATLCGDPAVAGAPGAGPAPQSLAGVPCLDRPHGIAVLWPRILVADRGNRAIQSLRPGPGGRLDLFTLAGGRELAAPRFGLLRDGIRILPPGSEYGALADPAGLAADPWGGLYIADARCVVQAPEPLPPAGLAGPDLRLSPGGRVRAGLALEVAFTGPRVPGEPEDELDRPVHCFWRLDCLDPASGGPAAAPARGELRGGTGSARVAFEQEGEADVVLTCVTAEGWSTQEVVRIRVE